LQRRVEVKEFLTDSPECKMDVAPPVLLMACAVKKKNEPARVGLARHLWSE